MCGICGAYFFGDPSEETKLLIPKATNLLKKRGPEIQDHVCFSAAAFGHSRLSIIDTSVAANQPFTDTSGRYTLVFNGEIYNYRELRKELSDKGHSFRTSSDTEVLLYWLIDKGEEGISQLNGFFAFAFYDQKEHSILVVRDRFGIKPLYFFQDQNRFIFASELKALMTLQCPRNIDFVSLRLYFQLNYIPAPWSIYQNVFKLLPGTLLRIANGEVRQKVYYTTGKRDPGHGSFVSYESALDILREKMETSVVKRLVSDVPLGAFLSGGIDSSVIVALASRHVKNLNTFSIGFRDQPMFDETKYARMVARMHKTEHTVFSLTNNDLLDCLYDVLDYTDEPFADSSALAVYILSRHTRQKVTVALSGDGADEMFAGYNKHMAHWMAHNGGAKAKLLKMLYPYLGLAPQSRSNQLANRIRQLHRFGEGANMKANERYWRWASLSNEQHPVALLRKRSSDTEYQQRKNSILKAFEVGEGLEQILLTDMQLVLPNDMLTKVDLMSMANSLEVRVPFLDHDVVDFVFSLPTEYKIDRFQRKKMLRDAFREELPTELYDRPKQGFEVPLLPWFRKELKDKIMNEWLSEEFIEQQGIFDLKVINNLKKKLFSLKPADIHAQVWSIIVFQQWYKKYHSQ
ncbi:MAG: asparagine synthase (glutamine-hydrolyzing) [Bacteroidales bacterium]